ncbi:MAG: proteasome subunit alpha [Actinomycetota bacterium]
MPYYVSPEQMMKDRADYARKGIARGRSVVAVECEPGIVITAENTSPTLRKIGELYDRIAFAAVGKYNEFENLRQAGVRLADLRGYAYGREDVTAKAVANAYTQALGSIFTEQMKPFEVEVLVAQVADTPEADEMYRVLYDGSLQDEHGVVVMGGSSDKLIQSLQEGYTTGLDLGGAVRLGSAALAQADPTRPITAENLEIALLDRARPRRAFRRLTDETVGALLQG